MVTDMETTETLTDLLEQWSEAEPERCLNHDEGDAAFDVRVGSMWYPMDTAVLLQAVVNAIDLRDFDCFLQRLKNRYWHARVAAEQDMWHDANHHTALHALLSAYLKALHAAQEVASDD